MKLVDEDRWVEIPWACMDLHNITWLRTFHGGDAAHFAYSFNKDGTISPLNEPDIVFGLADPSPCDKFKDLLANHLGWKKTRAEKKIADKEKAEKIEAIVEKQVSSIVAKEHKLLWDMITAQSKLIEDLKNQVNQQKQLVEV